MSVRVEESVERTESETVDWGADSDSSTCSASSVERFSPRGPLGPADAADAWPSPLPFPSLSLTHDAILCLPLRRRISAQISVCGSLRLVWDGKMGVMVGCRGSVIGVSHPHVRLVRHAGRTHAQIGSNIVSMGTEGIGFGSLLDPSRGYFTSSAQLQGTAMFSADRADWCDVGRRLIGEEGELTAALFRDFGFRGPAARANLRRIIDAVHFHTDPDGSNVIHIAGLRIAQDYEGRVLVQSGEEGEGLSLRLDPDSASLRLNFSDDVRIYAQVEPPPPKPVTQYQYRRAPGLVSGSTTAA